MKKNSNDLTRLERFKKWAKNNMGNLSFAAITIAGIITSIVLAARPTLEKGAQATGKFAKALYNIGKKVGALMGALLSFIGRLLSTSATLIQWLAQNLWAVVIALVLFMQYLKRKNIRRQ